MRNSLSGRWGSPRLSWSTIASGLWHWVPCVGLGSGAGLGAGVEVRVEAKAVALRPQRRGRARAHPTSDPNLNLAESHPSMVSPTPIPPILDPLPPTPIPYPCKTNVSCFIDCDNLLKPARCAGHRVGVIEEVILCTSYACVCTQFPSQPESHPYQLKCHVRDVRRAVQLRHILQSSCIRVSWLGVVHYTTFSVPTCS